VQQTDPARSMARVPPGRTHDLRRRSRLRARRFIGRPARSAGLWAENAAASRATSGFPTTSAWLDLCSAPLISNGDADVLSSVSAPNDRWGQIAALQPPSAAKSDRQSGSGPANVTNTTPLSPVTGATTMPLASDMTYLLMTGGAAAPPRAARSPAGGAANDIADPMAPPNAASSGVVSSLGRPAGGNPAGASGRAPPDPAWQRGWDGSADGLRQQSALAAYASPRGSRPDGAPASSLQDIEV
jgi:hypothetical protein